MFQPTGKNFPRPPIEPPAASSRLPAGIAAPPARSGAGPAMAAILAIAAFEAAAMFGLATLACRAPAANGILTLTTALALTMTAIAGGYSPAGILARARFLRAGMIGTATAFVAMAAILQVAGIAAVAPAALLGAGLLALGGVAATRHLVSRLLVERRQLAGAPRTVLVGGGAVAARLLHAMPPRSDPRAPRWLGYIDDRRSADPAFDLAFLGGLTELLDLIRASQVDQVIIALPWSAGAPLLELIGKLAECPVRIRLAPDLEHVAPTERACRAAGLIDLAEPPLSGWTSLLKRAEDLLLATLALGLFAVPMAIVALAIRLDSPGPVLFRQRRTGFNDRCFEMLKFRTMQHRFADPDGSRQATQGDPRITRVGALLRRTSLDELPQIFNVLAGDMSLVGPRPHAPGTRAGARKFNEVVAHYAARHRVRPGLTGLAQVRGLRGPTDTEEMLARRVDSDLEYIEHWSLWLDLAVLARTAVAVLRMTNAH